MVTFNFDKWWRLGLGTALVLAIIYLSYYWIGPALKGLYSFILPMFLPFVLALILASILGPAATYLQTRLKLNRAVAVLISITGILGGLLTGLVVLAVKLANELLKLSQTIPQYYDYVDYLWSLYQLTQNWYLEINLPAQVVQGLEDALQSFLGTLQQWAVVAADWLLNQIVALPELFMILLFTILGLYFIMVDWDRLKKVILDLLPERLRPTVSQVAGETGNTIVGFIQAQVILISITILITLAGLYLLQVNYAWLLAVVIGIADVLPVLGPGTVLVPWMIIEFISRDFFMGIALAVLYAIITVVRQVLQPKIVGQAVGLHPLETLVTLYAGMQAMGVLGIALGPLLWIVIKAVWRSGILVNKEDKGG